MDLRNQTITVGELLDNPKSRAVFQRRFGKLLNHPMAGAARTLTLKQLAEMAAGYPGGAGAALTRRGGPFHGKTPLPLFKTYILFSPLTGCQTVFFGI